MATSTFDRHFKVNKEKANEFVNEMNRQVPPTLSRDFRSKFVREGDVRPALIKAIGKSGK